MLFSAYRTLPTLWVLVVQMVKNLPGKLLFVESFKITDSVSLLVIVCSLFLFLPDSVLADGTFPGI